MTMTSGFPSSQADQTAPIPPTPDVPARDPENDDPAHARAAGLAARLIVLDAARLERHRPAEAIAHHHHVRCRGLPARLFQPGRGEGLLLAPDGKQDQAAPAVELRLVAAVGEGRVEGAQGDGVLLAFAVFMAMGLPTAFRMVGVVQSLRKRAVPAASPDAQSIPPETADAIIDHEITLRRTYTAGLSYEKDAALTLELARMARALRAYVIDRVMQRRLIAFKGLRDRSTKTEDKAR